MKTSQLVKYAAAAIAISLAPAAQAQLVNFDSVDTSGGAVSGAAVSSYLSGHGITFSATNPAVTPFIIPSSGTIPAVSSPNLFATGGGPNTGYTYRFTFDSLLDSLSFVRPTLVALTSSGVTMAQWSASAFASDNTLLDQVGENLLASFGTIAAQTFTLDGPSIHHVDWFTNVQNFAGSNLYIDNLSMTAAIPEPETYALLLAGLALLGFAARRRRLE